MERELLAIASSLHKCRYFIAGAQDLTIATEHKPLVNYLNLEYKPEEENRRMMNLQRRCENYQFNTIYICGEDNTVEDMFSRRQNNNDERGRSFLEDDSDSENMVTDDFWPTDKKTRVATLCNYFSEDSFININKIWKQEEDDLAEQVKDYSTASYAGGEHEGLLDTRKWAQTNRFHSNMVKIMENEVMEDVSWNEIRDHMNRDQRLQDLIHEIQQGTSQTVRQSLIQD